MDVKSSHSQNVLIFWDSIRNEDKTAPPGAGSSYFSHRESIGKVLSSPDIRSNKNTHINCGSSARMAGNVCANVDQIRRQEPMEQHNEKQRLSHQPFKRISAINGRLPHKCSGDPIQPTVAENAFAQLIMMFRKIFIQDSVLMMDFHPPAIPFGNIQSSLIQPICHSKGICCKLKLKNTILPTHSSNDVCLCTLDFKPRLAIRLFVCPSYYFAPSSPRHYFFASTVILFTPRRRTNERTSQRTNGR
ncbi:hypothetical protein [Absidia glauca]|uniref:Ndc10 domain-containing protein n=1 Tax=Absidia glauca TaxID=4829 RepID=A0A168LPM5_ABSGL|nr:hypothetical protein [Absidia glauca]